MLIPAPLFDTDSLFEEKKSVFYSLGIAVGICLQDHVLMDLPVNPLFLEYLRADVPAL